MRRGRRCSRAATPSPTCPRAAGRNSSASHGSPSGSPRRAPVAATCPTSRVSTRSSSRLSKMEADNVDPQQRMALELTWEALEHARIPGVEPARAERRLSTSAARSTTTASWRCPTRRSPHPYAITGTASSIIANRVSYFYDFRGPSVAVDTACSSSLVAVHQGVQALRGGEADMVLAGGVNALITPLVTIGFDEVGGVLAPDGRIKSFSQDADGYARSEGGGMLVLKRLADARRDGDEILAVIAGSAVNHDGRSNGLLAPNPDAQAEVLRKAYKDAGHQPARRRLHRGARHRHHPRRSDRGRRAGPRRRPGPPRRPARAAGRGEIQCGTPGVGRGRGQPGQGGAGAARTTSSRRRSTTPGPTRTSTSSAVHLKVADTVTDWPRYSGHAIAGVSGFGFGGANAHLVLREVLPSDLVEPEPEPAPLQRQADSGGRRRLRGRRADGRVRRVHRR